MCVRGVVCGDGGGVEGLGARRGCRGSGAGGCGSMYRIDAASRVSFACDGGTPRPV